MLVRLPPGMRRRLADAAEKAGRSVNAEVVSRMEDSFVLDDLTLSHDQRIDKLEYHVAELLRRLGMEA